LINKNKKFRTSWHNVTLLTRPIGTKMNDLELCSEVVQGHVNNCGVNSSETALARNFKFGRRLCIGNAERAHK